MIVLQTFLWIFFALVLLVCAILLLKITVRLKYGEQNAVIIGVGIVRINLTKLREKQENRKKKVKIRKLSKELPKKTEPVIEKSTEKSKETKLPFKEDFSAKVETDSDVIEKNEKKSVTEKNLVSKKVRQAHNKKDGGIVEMLKDFVKGNNLKANLSLLKQILIKTSEKYSKHARIKVNKLKVTVSCPEAADTAVLFGIANGAVCSIAGIIESFGTFGIEQGAIGVYQDYLSGKSKLEVDISLSMRVFGILQCVLAVLGTFLKQKTKKSSPKE